MTGRQRLLLRGRLRIPERRTRAHGRMTTGKVGVTGGATHAVTLGVGPADYHPVPVLILERIVHREAVVDIRRTLGTEGDGGAGHILIECDFRYRDVDPVDIQADLLKVGLEVALDAILGLNVRPAPGQNAEQERQGE